MIVSQLEDLNVSYSRGHIVKDVVFTKQLDDTSLLEPPADGCPQMGKEYPNMARLQ